MLRSSAMVRARRRLARLGFGAALLVSRVAAGQEVVTLVKDVNPGFTSSIPGSPPVVANGYYLFFTDDGVHGRELWRSDGTEAGTVLVKDINLAMLEGAPYSRVGVVGDELYFAGKDQSTGTEPWRSDGTEAGTTMVSDVETTSSMPDPFFDVNGKVFFVAGLVGERALYTSDGTASGTVRLMPVGAQPECIGVGALAYCATDDSGQSARGLFKSDGTVEGSVLVVPSSLADTPFGLRAFGNELLFNAYDSVHGTELWKTDGTEAGTAMVKDCAPGTRSGTAAWLEGNDVVFDGGFLFNADGGQGSYMWISDGTEAGTVPVGQPPGVDGILDFRWLTSRGRDVFFKGNANDLGSELWKTDGTAAGTVMVKDIHPGRDSGLEAQVSSLLVAGDWVFFVADDGTHGVQVWRSDGTEANTVRLTSFTPSFERNLEPVHLRQLGNRILFFADDGAPGAKLWSIDIDAPPVVDDGAGGTSGSGGAGGTGGSSGGSSGQAGAAASGGAVTGGAGGVGAGGSSGGSGAAGGADVAGGTAAGGTSGTSGGAGGTGGSAGDTVDDADERSADTGGCGCRTPKRHARAPWGAVAVLGWIVLTVRRRRWA